MYKYEITKYNPLFRDEKRRYLREDWTAISDIGKIFGDHELTLETYKSVEDNYISVIKMIMDIVGVPYLTVVNVRRSFSFEEFQDLIKDYHQLYSKEILDLYLQVKDFDKLDKFSVDNFCRLLLREDIGANVYYQDELEVYIGYDYLMSIHSKSSLDKITEEIEKLGLFIERF